jgi:precorrin-6B methylase 2
MGFEMRSVWILLEALVEMGYLAKNNDIYSVPKEIYERLVDESGDNYEGDFWQFLLYLVNPWRTLPHVLKHGKPDKSSYTGFSVHDFIKGMDSPWKKKIALEIVDICLKYLPVAKNAIDIGGAPGTIARAFASRNVHTLIFDLEECLAVMKDELSKIKNIDILSGDATKALPAGKFDIAFLGNLCHGQSPEDNAKIIKMCRDILTDSGIIVIFDNLRNESYLGAALALHMITQSPKGDIYSREQYFEWLEKAGFSDLKVDQLSDKAWQIVIGRK